jgi:catechol 2,3-dioxygenase-like lactoylglutathione lyase family enzyme
MNYTFHHTAISVRNLEKSLQFYKALGFKQVHRYDDDVKTNVHLQLGSYYIEMFAFFANKDKPPLQLERGNNLEEIGVKHLALGTDDIEAALADAKAKGLADDQTTIFTKDAARFFFIDDPDGVGVEIIKDDRY